MTKSRKSIFSIDRFEETAKKYYVRPLIYVTILGGQKIQGEFREQTDRYCVTELLHKSGSYPPKQYITGEPSARRLFEEALKNNNAEGSFPHLFNPLYEEKAPQITNRVNLKNPNQERYKILWHPANREIFNAAHIILSVWEPQKDAPKNNGSILCKIIKEISSDPTNYKPYRVKSLKTILSQDIQQRSLNEMLQQLRSIDTRVRNLSFANIESEFRLLDN